MAKDAKGARVSKPRAVARRKLKSVPAQTTHEGCSRSYSILKFAHDTAQSLLIAFEKSIQERGKARGELRGAPTDEQMDLLRAMLVFAGAGMDSMLKQLIRDSLPSLIELDAGVREGFEKFVRRRLRGTTDAAEPGMDIALLSTLLASESPRRDLIELYVNDLTGGSLQSADQLFKSVNALGLDATKALSVFGRLGEAFKVRNKIVHELDINFDHPNRNRQSRALDDMLTLTNEILSVASVVLKLTDERLTNQAGA